MKGVAQRPWSSRPFQTVSVFNVNDRWCLCILFIKKTTGMKKHSEVNAAKQHRRRVAERKAERRERWYCLCWVMLSAAYLSYGFHTCLSSSSQGQTQQTLPTMTGFPFKPSWRGSSALPATCICIGAATLKQIYHTHFGSLSGLRTTQALGSRRAAADWYWKEASDSAHRRSRSAMWLPRKESHNKIAAGY